MKLYRRISVVVALAAVASCWQAASAQSIQVYNNGARVGEARSVIDCRGTNTCTVTGGAVRITGDGGSGGASGWATAFDCDLTAQSSYPLDAGDGDYTICSELWNQFNSANNVNRPDLVNGTGLRMQPSQSTDFNAGTLTDPGFRIRITNLIPDFRWDMRVRISLYLSDNAAATYHHVYLVIGGCRNSNCSTTNYVAGSGETFDYLGVLKTYGAGGPWVTPARSIQGTTLVATPAYYFTANVVVADWPAGIGGGLSATYGDLYDGGTFPTPTPLINAGQAVAINADSYRIGTGVTQRLPSLYLFIAAGRAGSATGYTIDLKRLKVEYQP